MDSVRSDNCTVSNNRGFVGFQENEKNGKSLTNIHNLEDATCQFLMNAAGTLQVQFYPQALSFSVVLFLQKFAVQPLWNMSDFDIWLLLK